MMRADLGQETVQKLVPLHRPHLLLELAPYQPLNGADVRAHHSLLYLQWVCTRSYNNS